MEVAVVVVWVSLPTTEPLDTPRTLGHCPAEVVAVALVASIEVVDQLARITPLTERPTPVVVVAQAWRVTLRDIPAQVSTDRELRGPILRA
jgi:hypothetical protein